MIRREAVCFGIGWADQVEIDALNILQATFLAMRRALLAMTLTPDHVLVDGNRLPNLHGLGKVLTARAIIDGDVTEPAISAASILAKTARDSYMNHMDTIYPAYCFASHKGYATPDHQRLLELTRPLSFASPLLRAGAPGAAVRALTAFVHLRLHTEYSLVDGIVRVPELMAAVAAAGMPAVALTDQSNLFAMVKFYKEAQAAGVKPLIGVDAWIREPVERAPPSRIVFLCQNLVGYRHLTQLVTRSYLEGQHRGVPMLERSWLEPRCAAGLDRACPAAPRATSARRLRAAATMRPSAVLTRWQALCGDRFYLEVQRTGRPGERDHFANASWNSRSRRASARSQPTTCDS